MCSSERAGSRLEARTHPASGPAVLLGPMDADVSKTPPGVRRRRKADVPETLTNPISVFRPVRDHGQFVVDAVMERHHEIAEMKRRANENKR